MAFENNATAISDVAYDYTTHKEDSNLRSTVVELLDGIDVKNNYDALAAATSGLEKNDLLPSLVLDNFDHFDANHDDTVSYAELLDASSNKTDSLDYLLANWAATSSGIMGSLDTGYPTFTRNMVQHHVDASRPKEEDTEHTYTAEDGMPVAASQTETTPYVPENPWPDDVWKPAEVAAEDQTAASEDLLDGTFAATEEAIDPKLAAIGVLQSDQSTPEAQLKAVQDLAAMGVTTLCLTDKDGNPINVRLAVSPIAEGSSKSYVHMFAVDESGNETIVLRAITDGENLLHQRDKNGNEVGFVGTKWLANHTDSFFDPA